MKRRNRQAERGGIISSLIALVFLVVVLGGIYVARHPLLRYAGGTLVVEDRLEKSDAIIILSDDNFYADRATRAAELFRQNLAPIVVASGIRLRPNASIAELMTHDLIERGVPKENIIPFPQDADNTREEAEALRKLVQQKKWKSVIVVTSNYHTRRARMAARYIFDRDFQVSVVGTPHGGMNPDAWWKSRTDLRTFLIEFEKLVAYTLYIGPRTLARDLWTSRSDTSHSNTLLAFPNSYSMFLS